MLDVNKVLDRIYSKGWLNRALQKKKEFRGKSYLQFTNYNTYAELKKLAKIVEVIESYMDDNELESDQIRVLDLGCGAGNISFPLAANGYNVIGVDLNDRAIAEAVKRKNTKKLSNVQFFVKDALEYLDSLHNEKKFHVIIASELLEHLQNPTKLCNAVLRNLVAGGLFVMTLPNEFGATELFMTNPAKIMRKVLGIKMIPGFDHIQQFNLAKVHKLLVRSGFSCVKFVASIDFLSPFPFLNRSSLQDWI